MDVSAGKWIRLKALWPGIWRVSRAITSFNDVQWSLDASPVCSSRTLLFCDRIVNDKGKRSFATRSCEISYASPLTSDELTKLEELLATDVELANEFAKYQSVSHPIHLIANISLGDMNDEVATRVPTICDELLESRIQNGLIAAEVLQGLAEWGLVKYMSKNPRRLTLQLTCINHEVANGEFVFRKYRVLGT